MFISLPLLMPSLPVHIYTPESELAWRLAVRDISAQYRQSTTAVWLFLSTSKLVQVAPTDIPYPLFVFSGTLLWSILIERMSA